ncbi:MAG: MATE family efflux transporter [Pyramidobacter sp.]|nr:MATE family efflux transporter [Pyramidobacter sp.]
MNSTNKQITEGVIWKQILIFFFPILLGTFFQQLYNTLDAVIVGRFVGKVALAAVGGPTSTLINLLLGFFVGLSSGATVVIAQFFGAEDANRTGQAVHTSMALALAAGAVMSVGGALAAPWALRVTGTPAEVLPHAQAYLQIYFGGLIFTLIYNMGSGILRAKGDSKRPFYLLVAGTFINLVLDLLFVVQFGWGAAGVGWATVLAQAFCAAAVWVILAREPDAFALSFRHLKFDLPLLVNIVRIGFPAGLQATMYSFSNIVIQSTVNSFGVDTVAAWAAMGKADGLYWMIMAAFGVAITTIAGQNFGARKYDRVTKSIAVCNGMAFFTTAVISALLLAFAPQILSVFTSDAAVVADGVHMMWNMIPWYFTYVLIEIVSGGIRGTGDSFFPTVMTCLGICVFRLVWVWGVLPFKWNMIMLIWSYPISWTITSVLFAVYYYRSGWLKRSIVRAGHAPRQ